MVAAALYKQSPATHIHNRDPCCGSRPSRNVDCGNAGTLGCDVLLAERATLMLLLHPPCSWSACWPTPAAAESPGCSRGSAPPSSATSRHALPSRNEAPPCASGTDLSSGTIHSDDRVSTSWAALFDCSAKSNAVGWSWFTMIAPEVRC